MRQRNRKSDPVSVSSAVLPEFDEALFTRNVCVAGLGLSWFVSLACIAAAGYVIHFQTYFSLSATRLSPSVGEIIPLIINVIITFCIDNLGYIQSTSLRWALWRENRLNFNSNLRLFNGAHGCVSNSYFVNTIAAGCLVICYTSSSQLFIISGSGDTYGYLNGIALVALGICLFGQTFISSWCLSSKYVPTWSSNPLNTTLACLHLGLEHRTDRCMLAVGQSQSGPIRPSSRQPSPRSVNSSLKYIEVLLWMLVLAVICWASVILAVTLGNNEPQKADLSFPFGSNSQLYDASFTIGGPTWPAALQNVLAIVFVSVIQSGLTFGLHCIEVVVNLSRDEAAWRTASSSLPDLQNEHPIESIRKSKSRGARLSSSSIIAAFTSWQSIILFISKPVMHWLFGLGITTVGYDYLGYRIVMRCTPLYALSGCGLLLAVGTTLLIRHQPRTVQPASWGHLQTLADLVDDWGAVGDTLYWGDKGPNDDRTRHAGTSPSAHEISGLWKHKRYR